jgi:prolyl 4-hydroxylase
MNTTTPASQTGDDHTQALMRAADGGDTTAMLKLARLCDLTAQPDAALAWLQRAGQGGNTTAMTLIGCRLAAGRGAPYAPAEGVLALTQAAAAGHTEALVYLAGFAALGHGRAQSWAEAFDLLARAAGAGDARAAGQTELLRGLGVRSVADVGDWRQAPPGVPLWQSPHLVTAAELLPQSLCAHLITKAAPKLDQARIVDPKAGGQRPDPMRTNTGMGLSLLDLDLPLILARERLANFCGVPAAQFEPLNVLHYGVGQQYAPHWDFLDPSSLAHAEVIRTQGQRIKTVLVYLNDGYESGETDFPHLGIHFRGRPGEGLWFDNVGPDGQPDPRTLHAGLPPLRGEKWLLSQWVRDRPQPVV